MQGSRKVLCTLLNGDIVNDMSEPNHCVSSDFDILEDFSYHWNGSKLHASNFGDMKY